MNAISKDQAYLQFRWEKPDEPAGVFGHENWLCNYELCIPLGEHDIRRDGKDGEKVRDTFTILICTTKRGASLPPCIAVDGTYFFDAPYRDGAHATWDAPKMGGIPIICIAVDGTVIRKDETPAPETHVRGPSNRKAALFTLSEWLPAFRSDELEILLDEVERALAAELEGPTE